MVRVTERDMIRRVAERWKDQYFHRRGGKWGGLMHNDPEVIYNRLAALDVENATPQDIDDAGANISWISGWCSFCNLPTRDYVDNEKRWDAWATICRRCAEKVATLFSS